jgi:hypothetical protein
MPRRPGKFEGIPEEIPAEELYEIVLNGGAVDEIGSVDELGWYGLVEYKGRWYIVSEDAQGFFDADEFDSEREARKQWEEIVEAYDRYDRGEEVFARGGLVRRMAHRFRTRFRRRMNKGGVVEGPVEAVIGEAGPEAVTPLETEKAAAMAGRMADEAEEAAKAIRTDDVPEDIRRVLEALADFAEDAAEEAEEAADEAGEAAEEGDTAKAAAAATEAAEKAREAVEAAEAAEELAPRHRGWAARWWGV